MKFIIPGKPIAKARARLVRRGNFVSSFDPQHKEKAAVKDLLAKGLDQAFSSENKQIVMEASNLAAIESFDVSLRFYLPIPDRLNLAQKNAKLWGFEPPTHKPDVDNLAKFYLDCANGILWDDDARVVALNAIKYYSKEPRVEILLNEHRKCLPRQVNQVFDRISPDQVKDLINQAEFLIFCLNRLDDPSGLFLDEEIYIT